MKRLALFCAALLLVSCGSYTQPENFSVQSAALTRFWHRPVSVRAQVLVPKSYATSPHRRYPAIFWIHAFGGSDRIGRTAERTWQNAMAKAGREYILVFLDANFNGNHTAFADSANNGPWGTALVEDFLPAFDRRFRTLPSQRYLAGHSSGAWAALWLQVRYPRAFAGAWSIAPDPVDFRDFTGPDLTRAKDFYRDGSGRDYGFVRRGGRDSMTLRRFVTSVPWANAQYDSFDAAFSPRGRDGKPEQLFDRRSGRIDTAVARYWESHYDIDATVRAHWSRLAPLLNGKLHVIVGTADTYHLDEPVRQFAQDLAALHADAEIDFVPGADHNDIVRTYDEIERSVAEMGKRPTPALEGGHSNAGVSHTRGRVNSVLRRA